MVSRSLTALRTVSVSGPPCRISGRAYERQSLPPFEVFVYVAEDCKFKSQNVTIQNAVWPAKLKNFLCPPNTLWVHFFHQGKLKAVKYALHIKGLAFPELWLPKNNPELGDIIVKVVPYCSSCQIRHLARCAFISLRRLWAKHIPRICNTNVRECWPFQVNRYPFTGSNSDIFIFVLPRFQIWAQLSKARICSS